MSLNNVIMAAFIAVSFVGWPIIGKFAQATGAWTGFIVMSATAVAIALISGRELNALPAGKAAAFLILAGILNGIGVYFFAKKTSDPVITTSAFVVLVSVWMVACAPILDWILNDAGLTLRHMAGFVLAAGAIYLLSG
jgi:hypothetical protein